MTTDALRHLAKVDPVLKRVMRAVGPMTLVPEGRRSPFESLVRAVAHQQLHGAAAEKILGRFIALFPGKRFPPAAAMAGLPEAALRGVGFSTAKAAALRDIAAKTLAGVVPSARKILQLDDEEIVARLTTIRGVGRWTAEMLLIFQLGRPDVLPAEDFGVRNGFRVVFGLPETPKPKEVLAHGERWRPFRTAAAWYLWRAWERPEVAAEGGKASAPPRRKAAGAQVI
jgi:DNA-3-methyladenine glycosylase II